LPKCALVKLVILFDDAWYVADLDDAVRAIPVARFIHHLFPHLRDVKISDDFERADDFRELASCWAEWYCIVVAMVRSFSEVWEAASAGMESCDCV